MNQTWPQSPEKPVVSVVLGTYNRRPFLRKTIESIRGNEICEPYETIVVDGGSTDGSLDWLVRQRDIVTIVQHNRGEFRGRVVPRRSWGYFMNLGFKAAQGKYILMLSDDCLLLPRAVNRGVERFETLLAQGRAVGAVAFYFRNWPQETEYYVQATLGGKLMLNHGLYGRDPLEEIGWADEDRYVFYKADGDICLRMWSAGYEIVDCPGAYVEHYAEANTDVRATNTALLDHDRQAYVARWAGIYDVTAPGMSAHLYSAFEDPSRTADLFLAPELAND